MTKQVKKVKKLSVLEEIRNDSVDIKDVRESIDNKYKAKNTSGGVVISMKKVKSVKAWGFKSIKTGKLSNRCVPIRDDADFCRIRDVEEIVRVLITEVK